ncbi:hypothetical protein KP509_05G096000 [Ceratopteris richardii]|uniref:Uncharacterized protein n=1 Tax=Ceratopteris richardii TaxID=49495 RepID=A0A8T2UVM8_CERRI|nr:hypothetical protein KP509_05G096000 [Ceratopteris richardii]
MLKELNAHHGYNPPKDPEVVPTPFLGLTHMMAHHLGAIYHEKMNHHRGHPSRQDPDKWRGG